MEHKAAAGLDVEFDPTGYTCDLCAEGGRRQDAAGYDALKPILPLVDGKIARLPLEAFQPVFLCAWHGKRRQKFAKKIDAIRSRNAEARRAEAARRRAQRTAPTGLAPKRAQPQAAAGDLLSRMSDLLGQ